MKRISITILMLFSLLALVNCDKAEEFNKANGSWEFGDACTFTFKEKPGVLTQKYLNQIVSYYAGIEATDSLILTFENGGTISTGGKVLENSSWSQKSSDISFNIGNDLNFEGKVYVKLIDAKALNIQVDLLPEKVKSILELVIKDINAGVAIDELHVYLDKKK